MISRPEKTLPERREWAKFFGFEGLKRDFAFSLVALAQEAFDVEVKIVRRRQNASSSSRPVDKEIPNEAQGLVDVVPQLDRVCGSIVLWHCARRAGAGVEALRLSF
jgi:hypothetical protein